MTFAADISFNYSSLSLFSHDQTRPQNPNPIYNSDNIEFSINKFYWIEFASPSMQQQKPNKLTNIDIRYVNSNLCQCFACEMVMFSSGYAALNVVDM